MEPNDSERLVVVTSTPEGVAPLSAGERSMIEWEPGQVEQTAVVGHSFPNLLPGDPARAEFEQAKRAYSDSDANATISHARSALALQPNYLPAHIFEELGMNIVRSRDLSRCAEKCLATIALGEQLIAGSAVHPPTDRPVGQEHIAEILDIAHYNLSDRYMRLGKYEDALQHVRLSETLPKSTEARMKRRIKEASLLLRLKDRQGCVNKLRQARDMDRELFMLLRERMAFDGHHGVDQPI